jgi:hypothetical protein
MISGDPSHASGIGAAELIQQEGVPGEFWGKGADGCIRTAVGA